MVPPWPFLRLGVYLQEVLEKLRGGSWIAEGKEVAMTQRPLKQISFSWDPSFQRFSLCFLEGYSPIKGRRAERRLEIR